MRKKIKISLIWNIFCKVLLLFSLFFLVLVSSSCAWFLAIWGEMDFSIVVYQLFSPLEGTSEGLLQEYADVCLYPSIVRALFLFVLYAFWDVVTRKVNFRIEVQLLNKWFGKFELRRKNALFLKWFMLIVVFGVMTWDLWGKAKVMGIPEYLDEISRNSSLFEEQYISPNEVSIEFPQEKRNLLLVYLESMEMTYASTEVGGAKAINYIPELTQLAQENYNFSDSDALGGGHNYAGGWTMAGLLASSSGVPYKLPIEGNSSGEYETFLPGLTTLGEVLKAQGYTNYFMCGSDAAFGGREAYYMQHGDYTILDYDAAIKQEVIPADYMEYWGMEDEKLFSYAKQQLENIEEPFNFSMLTVDTHHPVGYQCRLCQDQHGDQLANAISCSSRQVYDFIEWVKQQEWYENTTIVLIGDHLSMNNTFWDDIGDYDRTIYNCFINVPDDVSPLRLKNREFSAVDMFPTILAAMDVRIEGDRLGLGTNLFSEHDTLPEEMGRDEFVEELGLYSDYYFTNFVMK